MADDSVGLVAKRAFLRILTNLARADGTCDDRERALIDEAAAELGYDLRTADFQPAPLRRLARRIPPALRLRLLDYLGRMPAIDGHASEREVSMVLGLARELNHPPPIVPGVTWPEDPPVTGVLDEVASPSQSKRALERRIAVTDRQRLTPSALSRLRAEGPPTPRPRRLDVNRRFHRPPGKLAPEGFQDTHVVLAEIGGVAFALALALAGLGLTLTCVADAQTVAMILAISAGMAVFCKLPRWILDFEVESFLRNARVVPVVVASLTESRVPSEDSEFTQQRARFVYGWGGETLYRTRRLDREPPRALGEWTWALVSNVPSGPKLLYEEVKDWLREPPIEPPAPPAPPQPLQPDSVSVSMSAPVSEPATPDPLAISFADLEVVETGVRSAGRVFVSVQESQTCPYCRDILPHNPRELMTCKECFVVFHRECIQEASSCTTMGCPNRRRRSRA